MAGEHRPLHELVRSLQVIVGAMLIGVITATAVLSLVAQSSTPPSPALASPLLVVLALLAFGQIGAWLLLRQAMSRGIRRVLETCPADERWMRLAGHLRIAQLIPAAMAESIGLFGAVVYLVTGAIIALAAPVAAAALLVVCFPTRDRVEQAIARLER